MILTQAQAEAVYSAMCALNSVGGAIRATFTPAFEGDKVVNVKECEDLGYITIIVGFETAERYETQAAFATTYGLKSDDWQSDVAAAAGGLTQTAIER